MYTEALGQLLSPIGGYHSLLLQITLITDQHYLSVVPRVHFNLRAPETMWRERRRVGDASADGQTDTCDKERPYPRRRDCRNGSTAAV